MGGEKGGAASQAPQPQTLKKKLPPYKPAPAPPMFDYTLKSDELQAAVKKLGFDPKGNLSTSLMDGVNITTPVPEPPTRPAVALTDEELLPPTPCVYVNDASEAFSPQLLDVCLRRPIVVVRNIASACGMDLSLYTTKTLVEMHPNHPVEIRTQIEQTSDENWDPKMEEKVWYCTSSRSHTTISKYAEYQAETIKEHFSKATEKTANPKYDFTGQTERKVLKFGTNCDISDEKKWSPQLNELNKLPAWTRVVSAGAARGWHSLLPIHAKTWRPGLGQCWMCSLGSSCWMVQQHRMECRSTNRKAVRLGLGALRMEQVPKIPIHSGHGIAKLEFSEKHQSHRCWPLQGYPNNIAIEPSIFDASPSLCQKQRHFNYASWTSQERACSLLRNLR